MAARPVQRLAIGTKLLDAREVGGAEAGGLQRGVYGGHVGRTLEGGGRAGEERQQGGGDEVFHGVSPPRLCGGG